MTYAEALAYLESFIHGTTEAVAHRDPHRAPDARLAMTGALLDGMGNPQRAFRSVHVGGTSGKGSIATFIASILQAAGYKTGLHTSPYVQTPEEKILVNGEQITEGDFIRLVEGLLRLLEGENPPVDLSKLSYVPVGTALTFQHFAQQHVDYGVAEVSLGGRYDPTNVLEPEVAVVTNVGLDHLNVLGRTVREIAWHKAGIVKQGIGVMTGVRQPSAMRVVEAECAEKNAALYKLGSDVTYRIKAASGDGSVFDATCMGTRYSDLEVGMLGEHQVSNACLALGAAHLLAERGARIPEAAIRRGLLSARIPGRMEIVQREPTVMLDGAHNPEKARTLRRALDGLFPSQQRIFVLGIGSAKDASGVLDALVPGASLVFCTDASVLGKPASSPESLAEQVRALGVEARVEPDPMTAVERALEAASSSSILCITGSLYLVGAVRGRWRSAGAFEQAATGAQALPAGKA